MNDLNLIDCSGKMGEISSDNSSLVESRIYCPCPKVPIDAQSWQQMTKFARICLKNGPIDAQSFQ